MNGIQFAISIIVGLIYIFLGVKYELWLWKKGMDRFRKWLEGKLGYSIKVVPGSRSISWEITSKAPIKKKIWLMIVSNAFFLLTEMFPIFLMAIFVILMFFVEILLH